MIATHQVLVKHPQVLQSYEDIEISNQHACTHVIPIARLNNHEKLTTVGFGFVSPSS